jgi:hypothetical protein
LTRRQIDQLRPRRPFGCGKPVDPVDENARAEPDQDLPRGVDDSEDREGDAAEQRRDALDATQQQLHHAREERSKHQRPDVHDQPGGDEPNPATTPRRAQTRTRMSRYPWRHCTRARATAQKRSICSQFSGCET